MRRKQFPRLPARRYLKPTRQLALGLERLEDRAQPASLSLSLADLNLAEDGPATTATITRTGDLSQALSVAIANSLDPGLHSRFRHNCRGAGLGDFRRRTGG